MKIGNISISISREKQTTKKNNNANGRSEGEEFLKEFLEFREIKYVEQKELLSLKGDSKSFRVADFYLPKYKVYLEFLGRWNTNEEHKTEYREKTRVYEANGIPCIYIYPENLGILDYVFNRRLRKVLKEYNLKRQLFRFNLKLMLEERLGAMFGFVFGLFLLILILVNPPDENYWFLVIVGSLYIMYKAYRIISGYYKHFIIENNFVRFKTEM